LAGKKKKKCKNAPAAPVQEASPEVPNDAMSKNFSKSLMGNPLKHFYPIDQLSYSSLEFKGDNSWKAEGKVTLGLEDDACTESGSWKMEPATADNSAIVSWVVVETTCVGRSPGVETRALLTLAKDGNYDVKMR